MSVIGTTYKQPRVLAHDAIALRELPESVYRPIERIVVIPWVRYGQAYRKYTEYIEKIRIRGKGNDGMEKIPEFSWIYDIRDGKGEIVGTVDLSKDVFAGSGFLAGEQYTAISTGAEGTVFSVTVQRVGDEGEIINFSIDQPTCLSDRTTNLNNGELFNIVWSPRSDQGLNDGSTAANIGAVIIGDSSPWDYGFPINPVIPRQHPDSDTNVPLQRMKNQYRQKQIVKYSIDGCLYRSMPEGSTLYIGHDLADLDVIMESGKRVKYYNIPAGSFMPVSVLTVVSASAPTVDKGQTPVTSEDLKDYILALF